VADDGDQTASPCGTGCGAWAEVGADAPEWIGARGGIGGTGAVVCVCSSSGIADSPDVAEAVGSPGVAGVGVEGLGQGPGSLCDMTISSRG